MRDCCYVITVELCYLYSLCNLSIKTTGVLLTIIMMGRLDKSFFVQGWEWWDPGYRTFISVLLLDAYYSNPVLMTAVRYVCRYEDLE